MDWQDDEFETFLRQFRPSKPKALPTQRPRVAALATATLIVVAVILTARYGLERPAADKSTQTSASIASGSPHSTAELSQGAQREMGPPDTTLDRVPRAEVTTPGAQKSTAVASGSPRSNRLMSTKSGASNQRLRVG